MLVTQIERAKGYRQAHRLRVADRIGAGHAEHRRDRRGVAKRTKSLHFGSGDYAGSIQRAHAPYRRRGAGIRDARPMPARVHWGDPWHYALSRIVVAARANGLRPIDGPFGDFHDPEGFRAAARRVAAMGVEGKWAIHPSQIALANEVFTPAPQEVERARRIVAAMAEAERQGRGAVTLDGRMIDAASIRQAEALLKKARDGRGPLMRHYLDFEKPIAELEGKIEELRHLSEPGRAQYRRRSRRG